MLKEKCLYKKYKADRDNGNTHEFYQFVQGTYHLGLLPALHFLGLQRQTGNVGVLPDFIKLCVTLPRHNEAAGHKLVAFSLGDLIRFSGEQGFVDLYFPGAYQSVSTDLVAGFKDDHIIQHQLLCIYHRGFAVSHDRGIGGVEHGQIIQNLLGPYLLYDTDQCVGNDDREKSQVSERTYDTQQDCQHYEDQVKVCEDIVMYDLFRCLGRRVHSFVGPAVKPVFLYLLTCQPGFVIRIIPGGWNPAVFFLLLNIRQQRFCLLFQFYLFFHQYTLIPS